VVSRQPSQNPFVMRLVPLLCALWGAHSSFLRKVVDDEVDAEGDSVVAGNDGNDAGAEVDSVVAGNDDSDAGTEGDSVALGDGADDSTADSDDDGDDTGGSGIDAGDGDGDGDASTKSTDDQGDWDSTDPQFERLFGSFFDVPLQVSNQTVHVQAQLALSRPEEHHGLMYRQKLPDAHGLFFMYPTSKRHVLYMRHTSIPLDAGWFDEQGTLLEVMHLKPFDETWVWTKSHTARFGLEMPAGFFAGAHADPGAAGYPCDNGGCVKVDMPALAMAVQAKGHDLCSDFMLCNPPSS